MLVSSPVVDMARYGLGIVSTPANPKRRRTHVWFAVYTIIVLAVFALSLIKQQWSVAATAFLIALVFVFATRWLWRRR